MARQAAEAHELSPGDSDQPWRHSCRGVSIPGCEEVAVTALPEDGRANVPSSFSAWQKVGLLHSPLLAPPCERTREELLA